MVNSNPQNLLPFGGEMFYFPHFFTKEESDYFFHVLQAEIAWKHDPIKFYGKMIMQPRLTAMYGDEGEHYAYSGINMPALLWTDTLRVIKHRVEEISETKFNIALLNLYRDNKDSVSWHRDHEKGMGKYPTIASVSLGATRTFQVRTYKEKENKLNFALSHGSLVLMKGDMQNIWEHQVPKSTKETGARINITFRYVSN